MLFLPDHFHLVHTHGQEQSRCAMGVKTLPSGYVFPNSVSTVLIPFVVPRLTMYVVVEMETLVLQLNYFRLSTNFRRWFLLS